MTHRQKTWSGSGVPDLDLYLYGMKQFCALPSPVTNLHPFVGGVVSTLISVSFSCPCPWLSK